MNAKIFFLLRLLAIGAEGSIVSVENGNFGKVSDGKPNGWDGFGQYRAIDKGGVDGKSAVELTCDGAGKTSGLTQVVRPTSELVGSVRISAWMKCIEVEDGGDCSVWLDTLLEDGGAIWGKQGVPERGNNGWQKVSAIVTYDKPIKEVKVFLLLRNAKGKVLFSDVRIDDTPLEIRKLLVLKADDTTYDVQGVELFQPDTCMMTGGFFGGDASKGKGGPADVQTGYLSPIAKRILDHNINLTYKTDIIVGSIDEIRAHAREQKPHPLSWDFNADRLGWTYENAKDAGCPVCDGLKVTGTAEIRRIVLAHKPWIFQRCTL